MISAYFLWFDNWTFKQRKIAKIWNHSVSAYDYLHKWLVHLNFDMFIAAMFIFSCAIPKYVQG